MADCLRSGPELMFGHACHRPQQVERLHAELDLPRGDRGSHNMAMDCLIWAPDAAYRPAGPSVIALRASDMPCFVAM